MRRNPHAPFLFINNGFDKRMVGAIGVEPTTPTVSRWCSATELRANRIGCRVDLKAYNLVR